MPSPMAPKSVTDSAVRGGWGSWILVGVADLEASDWRRRERIKRMIIWRSGVVIGGDLGSLSGCFLEFVSIWLFWF